MAIQLFPMVLELRRINGCFRVIRCLDFFSFKVVPDIVLEGKHDVARNSKLMGMQLRCSGGDYILYESKNADHLEVSKIDLKIWT